MTNSKSVTMFNRKIIIAAIIILTIAFGSIATWFYINNYSKRYNKPSFEKEYTQGKVEISEQYGYSEMQICEDYQIGLCGAPSTSTEGVDLYFSNPEGNNVYLKCILFDEGNNTIGETGLIKPNSYVKTIKFKSPQPIGPHSLDIKILGFEPETYYSKGVVNLKTNVNIE